MRKRLALSGLIDPIFRATQSHVWYARRMCGRIWQAAIAVAIAALVNGPTAAAQDKVIRYGGEPPWGLEKPVHISGNVHRGEVFEQAIGRGLYFILVPIRETRLGAATETAWKITVADGPGGPTGSGSNDLMEGGKGMPCHDDYQPQREINTEDPGVGKRIELSFNLTERRTIQWLKQEDRDCECASSPNDCWLPVSRNIPKPVSHPKVDIESGGRLVFVATSIATDANASEPSLKFEVDLSFTAALHPWELPARYITPKGYKGWVRVYTNEPGAPPLPKRGEFYVVKIPQSGVLHTSSKLRDDYGGSEYAFTGGTPMKRPVWEGKQWECDYRYDGQQVFFVGTDDEYKRMLKDDFGGPRQEPCSYDKKYRGTCKESVNGKPSSTRACLIALAQPGCDPNETHMFLDSYFFGDNSGNILMGPIVGPINIVGNKFEATAAPYCEDWFKGRSGGGTVDDHAIKGTISKESEETDVVGKKVTISFEAKRQTWR